MNASFGHAVEKTLHATLPSEQTTMGPKIILGPHTFPAIVNERWRLEPGQRGTFESYRWPWPFNKKLRWRLTEIEEQA